MNLVYKHEKTLFTLLALFSGLAWLVLIGVTFGIALLYILLGYVAYLFAHSGFISYLKGTGVRITADHYPELHASLMRCCQTVGVETPPDAYILRADVFNALATRFRGRNFVVLFSDVLDALESRPSAVDFYIGHEIGHIHRGHLKWQAVLFPGMLLPLLGAAYRRAEEYTCDRYGAVCCQDDADAVAALAAIAAGDTHWKTFRVREYLKQRQETSGFWMSFNELLADYPWLTKRMAAVLAFRQNKPITQPRRHAAAWLLAAFIPRFGGGALSLLVTIAIIGILAAIAIPAYQGYVQQARIMTAYQAALPLEDAVVAFATERNAWPTDLTELGYPAATLTNTQPNYEIGLYDDGVIGVNIGKDDLGKDRYIVLTPSVQDGTVNWRCSGQNIVMKTLPKACQTEQ